MRVIQDKKTGRSRGKRYKQGGLMRTVRCAGCGGKEKVPFIPSKERPVYCSKCLGKGKKQ